MSYKDYTIGRIKAFLIISIGVIIAFSPFVIFGNYFMQPDANPVFMVIPMIIGFLIMIYGVYKENEVKYEYGFNSKD